MSGKTLVAYFSASGVTEAVARRLADAIGADVFEIAPREAYTAADLDWTDSSSRSTRECKDPACRPALKSMPEGDGGIRDRAYWLSHLVVYRSKHHQDVFGAVGLLVRANRLVRYVGRKRHGQDHERP